MSKRQPSEYNLYVKKHMADLKKDYAGRVFKASEAMSLIARMWRNEHGLASPAKKSPSKKSPKGKGCSAQWAAKCAAKSKVCHVSPKSGRRSCVQSPESKKAKAKAAAKAYRAKKAAALMSFF